MNSLLDWLKGRLPRRTKIPPSLSGAPAENDELASTNPPFVVRSNGQKRSATLPSGTRIYAVGDIHGQLVNLQKVLGKIKADIRARPIQDITTVFVGDYIDRGLASKAVIDTLINEDGIGSKITLRGNHEELMLAALDDPDNMKDWCTVGGIQTAFSYGVDVQDLMVGRGYEAAQKSLRNAVPRSHTDWLHGLPSRHEIADFFFCHAGIDPDKSIESQVDADLLWIRRKFTNDERTYSKIIVHGHSPVEQVDVRHNRINVDTGAFFTGNLACVALEAGAISLISS